MTTCIFLGPSLPVGEASQVLDAIYLPPAQQGDVLRALERKPRFIGIIDGYFETVPAVWHKEILFAMRSGVHVFGAASMGALRAAELHPFGMVGVGTIFEWYRDGVVFGDDEVAVSHGPAELGYLPLSDALVDIRDCCTGAVQDGIIGPELAERLVAAAGSLPFPARSYDTLAKSIGQEEGGLHAGKWLRYCRERGRGLKARDALALLRAIKEAAGRDQPSTTVSFEVERTVFFERLRNEIALDKVSGKRVSTLDESRELRAGETIESLRRGMLLRLAARDAAVHLGWQLGADEVAECAGRFCARFNIPDEEARRAWMQSESISDDAFWQFINDTLLIERLDRLYSTRIGESLADHLRLMTAKERLSGDR